MATHRDKVSAQRPLEALGLSESEESAYECLLAHSGATVKEIARVLSLSPHKTQRLLGAIEAKGLATHSPERPRRYIASAPDIAMEALVVKRQEDLQNARVRIQELKERAATHRPREQEQVVELIVSREAQRQAFEQLQRTAQHEIVCLTRLPIITELAIPGKGQAAAKDPRGLSRRCIIDQEYLALPGAIDVVRHEMEKGEITRIFPQLPLKLVLADRRIALVPLNLQFRDTASLLVRSSALLEALYALFETLWEQAVPISFTRAGALKTTDPDIWPTKEAEDLLALLAAGLNDKTIAHQLDLSLRTLKRRISELMQQQKARTRFQLAWSVTHRLDGNQRLGSDKKRRAAHR